MAQTVSLGHAAECAVCIAPLSPRDIFYTPCSHAFHYDCIIKWITERSATCPNCRQIVTLVQIRRLHVTLTDDTTVAKEIARDKTRIATLESENAYLHGKIQKWALFSENQNMTIGRTSSLLRATQEELAAERLQHAETTEKFQLQLAAEREKHESALIACRLTFDAECEKREETAKKLEIELVRERQNGETAKKLEEQLAAERLKFGVALVKLGKKFTALRQKYEKTEEELTKDFLAEREEDRETAKQLEMEKAQLVQTGEASSRRVNQQRIEKPTKKVKLVPPNPAKTLPPDFDGIAARTRSRTRMMR